MLPFYYFFIFNFDEKKTRAGRKWIKQNLFSFQEKLEMVNTVPNRLKLRTIAFGLLQQVGARSPPPSPHSFVIILKALKGQTRNNSVVRNFSKTNGFSSITHYDVTKHWRTHCRKFKHLVSQMYTITLILLRTVSVFFASSTTANDFGQFGISLVLCQPCTEDLENNLECTG